ncbi:hypothetical protein KFK09_026501 [Dendrobium nobile]|uniref:BHLH domain-containing protein n=1 Tax=Dendrobium nobile TaxID=94219 RepID=A0A8T3A8X1_DENNO|nr:hypothetical protein KFK09_026501 [Dendrobium nobile]
MKADSFPANLLVSSQNVKVAKQKATVDLRSPPTLGPTSRWSRAILFGPCRGGQPKLKLKACSKIPRHRPFLSPGKLVAAQTKGRKVRDRLRVLSRLVPGCKKLPAASVLSETADYVATLQMQVGLVNSMLVLAEVLSTSAVVASLATRGDGELGVEELR